jgi:hypothetical protein
MDKICADVIKTVYGYDELSVIVNEKSLDVFLAEKTGNSEIVGLYPAWGNSLVWKEESEFIWELLNKQNKTLNIPILLCTDDLDLSCIVIVAKTSFDDKQVFWEKIGYISRKNYDLDKEIRSGILDIESWSDEDFEKYGGTLAWCDINDAEWKSWVSENWHEEKMRRLHNYTYKFYQNDENVDWFEAPRLEFLREDYTKCLEKFRNEI